MILYKNTDGQLIYTKMVDNLTTSPITDGNVSAYISRDGSNFVPSVNQVLQTKDHTGKSFGIYSVNLTSVETDCDSGVIFFTNSLVGPNNKYPLASIDTVFFQTTALNPTVSIANGTYSFSTTGSVGSVKGSVEGNIFGNLHGVVGGVDGDITGTVAGVNGDVSGTVGGVYGNITGNVNGTVGGVIGNITGNLLGSVATALTVNTVNTVNNVNNIVDKTGFVLANQQTFSTSGSVGSVAGNIEGTVSGVKGNIDGNLKGDIEGGVLKDVKGSLLGNVIGSVSEVLGNIKGNVEGNVVGTVAEVIGNVQGDLFGKVAGSVSSVTGNVVGNIQGDIIGNVVGNVHGNIEGSLIKDVKGSLAGDILGSIKGKIESEINVDSVKTVTNPVVVGTNNDKNGYSLAENQNFSTSGSVGKVVGDVEGNVIGTIGGVQNVNNIITSIKNAKYDDVSQETLYELILAFITNNVTITSAQKTQTISYKKRDGTTEIINISTTQPINN